MGKLQQRKVIENRIERMIKKKKHREIYFKTEERKMSKDVKE
jgi:hypothetical protein